MHMLISSYSWKYETGTLITFLFIQMVHGMEDDWNGAVAASFIMSSQSWEIGSPPTGGAGRMKLSCVVPALVIHILPIHIS